MIDIAFKCPECESDLSVSNKGAGSSFACPECEKTISIPWPDIRFLCSCCDQISYATFNLSNKPIACPKCNQSVIVPRLSAKTQALQTQKYLLTKTQSNFDHTRIKAQQKNNFIALINVPAPKKNPYIPVGIATLFILILFGSFIVSVTLSTCRL